MLKLLVLKFRPDLFARFRGIAENQVPAKLKLIVTAVTSRYNSGASALAGRSPPVLPPWQRWRPRLPRRR